MAVAEQPLLGVHNYAVDEESWAPVLEGRRETMRQRYDAYERCFRSLGIVFVHIPKCAGSSFEKALFGFSNASQHAPLGLWKQRLGDEFWAGAVKFAVVRNPYFRLLSGYTYWKSGALGTQAVDRPFVHRCRTELDTLPKFVDYLVQVARQHRWDENDLQGGDGSCPVQFRPQWWFLSLDGTDSGLDVGQLTALLRFEALAAGYSSILASLSDGQRFEQVLPHTRASIHPRFLPACFAEPSFRAAVWEIYRKDFELFGYDPDDITVEESFS